jgi:hypothetical protein
MATRRKKAVLGTVRMAAAEAAARNERLVAALNPGAMRVSPMFHALLAVLLGQTGWSRPSLVTFVITSDDFIVAMREGDIGCNDFLGTAADLRRNIVGVCKAAELADEDRDWLLAQVDARKSS